MVKYERAKQISIVDIDSKYMKREVIVVGLVDKVIQTGGPTVFAMAEPEIYP